MKRKLLFAIAVLMCSVGAWAQNPGDDMTSYITNPTFTDNADGWTIDGQARYYNGKGFDGTTNFIELCKWDSDWDATVSQTVNGLTNGYYLVKAAGQMSAVTDAWMKLVANGSESQFCRNGDSNGNILADGTETTYGNGVAGWRYTGVVAKVTNGTLEISCVGHSNVAARWANFDAVTLTYLGAKIPDETDLTYAINNHSFETGDVTGWTLVGNSSDTGVRDNSNGTYTTVGVDGNKLFNTWWQGVPMTQTIANMPNGDYQLKVAIAGSDSGADAKIFLLAEDGHSDVITITRGTSGTFNDYTYDFTVTDHTVTIGIVGGNDDGSYNASGHWWYKADNFRLIYKGLDMSVLQALLSAAVTKAQGLVDGNTIPNAAETALQAVIDANSDDSSFDEEDQYTDAINAINTAYDTYKALETPYAAFNALKTAANAIAGVAYEETTSGSHTTFTTAISTQYAAAEAATTASAINTAISTLKAAIKAYVNGAEPTGGASFEITCLVENPSFDNNTIDGWTRTNSGGGNAVTSYTCNEFWNNTFDFYQDLAGLPNGSYQLSVQAYCRPGDNGNLTDNKKAYYDYTQNINNVHAELYVNSDASKVGNIYAYKDATSAKYNPGDWTSDYECVVDGGTNYFVPNSMAGASKYFADENVYKTEVAALVTDGNLRIGFRDETLTTSQWTIFDNFRLFYYGSDKLVYYKQYLPQLRTEVSADLSNGAYANVLVSSEDEALDAALAADPASETEEAYETVINALKDAQTAFRAAAPSYNAMVAAQASSLTKISDNIGTGVFQYNETTNNSLYSAYKDAQDAVDDYAFTTSSTAAGAQALVDALDDAIDNYNNQPLNAPDAEKRYVLTIVDDEKAWNGNAVTFMEGAAYPTQGNYGIKYLMPTNVNMAQAVKFTATSGNKYKVSILTPAGTEQYITTSHLGYDAGTDDTNKERIRTTNDVSKALEIDIQATTTTGEFKLYNTDRGAVIANNDNNDMFTKRDANFTIAEASQASVTVSAKAGKYGTVIFPFTPDVSGSAFDNITFYSCSDVNDVTNNVLLEEVTTPVANVPYMIKNTGSDLNETLTGWGAAYKDSYTTGLLTGTYTAATIAASDEPGAETEGAYRYVLQTPTSGANEGIQAFYKVTSDFTSTAYKCYLTVPVAATGGGEVKAFYLDFGDDTPTAINAVEAAQNENAEIYNLAGQRMSKTQKGVNIINGKKVLVK